MLQLQLASSSSQQQLGYWNSVLPNSPIPVAIRGLLQPQRTTIGGQNSSIGIKTNLVDYCNCGFASSPNELQDLNPSSADLFFLAKDMQPGANKVLHLTKTTTGSPFLPREVASSIPFSLARLYDILTHFAIKPDSKDANGVKSILDKCEQPAGKGETKYCATSLESMVEFVMSSFGTRNVRAFSTTVEGNGSAAPKQNYTVESPGMHRVDHMSQLMACHGLSYMYAVFYCHATATTEAYRVAMVGDDGTKVVAYAICHTNTSGWNPKHIGFRVLNVKSGSPVCHFMPQDHVVWITD